MAAAPATAACLFPKAAAAARKSSIRCSVGGVPPPPRLSRRRNYLRRKLLKTLTKPSPETLTVIQKPAEENQIDVRDIEFEAPEEPKAPDSENQAAENPEFDAIDESEASSSDAKGSGLGETSVSEGSGVVEASPPSGLGRVSARTVVRFGALFVGIYILQAIIRALVVDSADSSDDKRRKRRNRGKLGLNENGNAFTETLEMKDGALLYTNEVEMEAKFAEIRMMAREAKERESKNTGDGDSGSDDDIDDSDDEFKDDTSRAKSGIEGEIDGRLSRVRRGLDKHRVNPQVINVNSLNQFQQKDVEKVKKNVSDEREEDEMLMFEKKYKFRNGDSSKPRDKPKGFQGSDQIGKNGSLSKKDNDVKKPTEISSQFQAPKKESEDESKKMVQFTGDVQDAAKHVKTRSSSRSNGNIVRKETGDSSDLWWLKLPYLFAIAMQEGYDEEEGERGFYALTAKSNDSSETPESYTVLFEDRVEAHNFCHLLESHFEELEDIDVFVIPLPMKELNDAVKSHTKRVIVVRKAQLRLYAGQPLDEVETVLRSMIR